MTPWHQNQTKTTTITTTHKTPTKVRLWWSLHSTGRSLGHLQHSTLHCVRYHQCPPHIPWTPLFGYCRCPPTARVSPSLTQDCRQSYKVRKSEGLEWILPRGSLRLIMMRAALWVFELPCLLGGIIPRSVHHFPAVPPWNWTPTVHTGAALIPHSLLAVSLPFMIFPNISNTYFNFKRNTGNSRSSEFSHDTNLPFLSRP